MQVICRVDRPSSAQSELSVVCTTHTHTQREPDFVCGLKGGRLRCPTAAAAPGPHSILRHKRGARALCVHLCQSVPPPSFTSSLFLLLLLSHLGSLCPLMRARSVGPQLFFFRFVLLRVNRRRGMEGGIGRGRGREGWREGGQAHATIRCTHTHSRCDCC